MNVRRVIVGALQLLLAFFIYDEAESASRLYAFANSDSGSMAAASGIMLAAACAVTGLIFIITNKQNKRWIYWTISIITAVMFLISLTSASSYFKDLTVFAWAYIILSAIGVFRFGKQKPTNESGSDVPAEPDESENNKNGQQSSSSDSSDELRNLKKLLDEGVITQDEFDAKKKQLLGI